ncbi:unnamed protein product, partial [Chrysoparadoxa australica]
MFTAWQKPTRRSLTSVSNQPRFIQWHARLLSSVTETLVFVRTLMRAKPRPPSGYCSIQVFPTRSVKFMMVQLPWTGWSRSRSVVLPSPLLR